MILIKVHGFSSDMAADQTIKRLRELTSNLDFLEKIKIQIVLSICTDRQGTPYHYLEVAGSDTAENDRVAATIKPAQLDIVVNRQFFIFKPAQS